MSKRDSRRGRYRAAAREAVSMSVGPYGYTLTIWTSGAVLTHARGFPGDVEALSFMVGAIAGFALVGIASFGALTARVRIEAQPAALWAGFHVVSVGSAIAATTAIAQVLANRGAWPVGGFAGHDELSGAAGGSARIGELASRFSRSSAGAESLCADGSRCVTELDE
jgi:hypothetical protein